jgi:hypothetical protein
MPKWYGGNPSIEHQSLADWTTVMNKGDKWKFNVYRLPFKFSTLDFGLMDQIVDLAFKHKARVVLDFHCLEQYKDEPKLGSIVLRELWAKVAHHYKANPKIMAYELANEPSEGCLTPALVGNNDAILHELANLTDYIRKTDTLKMCVWSPSSFWGNIKVPQKYRRINTVNAIHPYSYGKKKTWEELKAIADYRMSLANNYVTQFDKGVWCGEIECHSSGASTPDLEREYVIYTLNQCYMRGFGMSYWKYGGTDDYGQDPDNVISKTTYATTV